MTENELRLAKVVSDMMEILKDLSERVIELEKEIEEINAYLEIKGDG